MRLRRERNVPMGIVHTCVLCVLKMCEAISSRRVLDPMVSSGNVCINEPTSAARAPM